MLRSMYAAAARDNDDDLDQHVVLRGMSWKDFVRLLVTRGDRSSPRMYFLDGEIELMSPGSAHEYRKKALARLLEAWSVERQVVLEAYGSWTLKKQPRRAGAEPDECYIVGAGKKSVPDLAIEVEWSRGNLEKYVIYARLGVPELWTLERDGRLVIRVLARGAYVERAKSAVLPKLDVAWLSAFLAIEPQTKAVHAMLAEMRRPR